MATKKTWKKRKKKKRICLKCGKQFDSEGPWNRLCSSCQQANAAIIDWGATLARKFEE